MIQLRGRPFNSLILLYLAVSMQSTWAADRHAIPKTHPRLLGNRQYLQQLARAKPTAYKRVVSVARKQKADDHAKMISMALVTAIEGDSELGRQAVQRAMTYVDGPIKKGHTTFGHDLARCALVYDLCHEYWTPRERERMHRYVNATAAANVRSETHVFHNGWYGYKNWGIGLACYATYHENPQAPRMLRSLEREFKKRAAPALELAGAGGGWAEGYYVHYWLYEWLFFCEVARRCEGVDYYDMAPTFFRQRAVASMFEMYPGIVLYHSRRPIPMGDGGGRTFGGDRDKALTARRMLVNHFRQDPSHQVVHTFNESTPRTSVGVYAYKDLLWRETDIENGDLASFKLSHVSKGPGHVHARSSWDEEATHFFFTCGDRFTAHQHLDVGHFLIYRHAELVGDGGHYDGFGTRHDVNYHLRTIAHNTVLIHDPSETWPGIRAGTVTGNDGGQSHSWPHHNGAVVDADAWHQKRELYDIADLLALEDHGDYLYTAGDCTRAYSRKKLEHFTRQIVFIRPGTFIIFDRVRSRQAHFKKTWLLQAMKAPERKPPHLIITNGKGRLFMQTLLPENARVRLAMGAELYRYDGQEFLPSRDTGPAPEDRLEVSPPNAQRTDFFLHVLTATASSTSTVPRATATSSSKVVKVTSGDYTVAFFKESVGGWIQRAGKRKPFVKSVRPGSER